MNDVMTKALKAARAVIEDEGYEVKQAVLTATFEPDEAGYRNGASAFPADMEDALQVAREAAATDGGALRPGRRRHPWRTARPPERELMPGHPTCAICGEPIRPGDAVTIGRTRVRRERPVTKLRPQVALPHRAVVRERVAGVFVDRDEAGDLVQPGVAPSSDCDRTLTADESPLRVVVLLLRERA